MSLAGGQALDAAIEAVKVMEDAVVFNAGRGSVLNREGHVQMDASVMHVQHDSPVQSMLCCDEHVIVW